MFNGSGFGCLPSGTGCYGQVLSSYIDRARTQYDDVNRSAREVLENISSSNVKEVVDSVVGNGGLMEGIRQAACATKSIVTDGMEEMRSCFTNENSLTATHGLGTDEDAYIFMLAQPAD